MGCVLGDYTQFRWPGTMTKYCSQNTRATKKGWAHFSPIFLRTSPHIFVASPHRSCYLTIAREKYQQQHRHCNARVSSKRLEKTRGKLKATDLDAKSRCWPECSVNFSSGLNNREETQTKNLWTQFVEGLPGLDGKLVRLAEQWRCFRWFQLVSEENDTTTFRLEIVWAKCLET